MQSVQSALPVVGLNVPAEQDVQVPFVNVYPVLQEQDALPLELWALAAHGWHSISPSTSLKVPAAHKVQFPGAPVIPTGQMSLQSSGLVLARPDSLPAGQARQVALDVAAEADEKVLKSHSTQAVEEVCALPAEYLPGTQPAQGRDPVLFLYVPAAQLVQLPPSGPVKPWSHTQSCTSSLAAAELEFAGHRLHAFDPTVALYLPASHAAHCPPSGPVYPLLHRQILLPFPECASAEQGLHVASDVWAVAAENLPCEHCTQPEEPLTSLNWPAGHATHSPSLGPVYPTLH